MLDDEELDALLAEPPLTPAMRLRALVETDRIDVAAVLWVICTLAIAGAQACGALFGTGDTFRDHQEAWNKIGLLSQTTGPVFAVMLAIGLIVAAAYDSDASRLASMLALAGALWMTATGFMFMAFTIWGQHDVKPPLHVTAPQLVIGLAEALIGALLAGGAYRLTTSVRDFDDDFDDADDDEVEDAPSPVS